MKTKHAPMKFAKLVFSIIFLCCMSVIAAGQSYDNSNVKAATFSMNRGTNIAHWLSQSKKRGSERSAFFTKKDLEYIKSAGFDHIRLPMDEEQLWDSTGKKDEEAFALLNNCLNWASQTGLKVVLDLHILRSHYFNAKEKPLFTKPEEQDKFISLWQDISAFVGKRPNNMVAYELMNEPVADSAEQWNAIVARATDSIRSWEKERTILIGSNMWQSVNTFDQLKVPANDKNIILSFHFYEPFFLTHYRASWTDLKSFEGEVQYPGQIVVQPKDEEQRKVYNRDTLEKMMAKPLRVADSLGLKLYCGEFGVIDGAPEKSKIAFYKDLVAIFDKHGIGYANWNYKAGSFGIVDAQMRPNSTLVNILTGRK